MGTNGDHPQASQRGNAELGMITLGRGGDLPGMGDLRATGCPHPRRTQVSDALQVKLVIPCFYLHHYGP